MKKACDSVRCEKNDYSVGLRQFFIDTITKNGGQIVADESYGEGDIDFKAQLTKIRAANPDGIYVPGYYTEVGLICRQARELGITVPLMGGDGWDSDKTFEIGRDAVNGCYFTNHYSPDEDRPQVEGVCRRISGEVQRQNPGCDGDPRYDSMDLMAECDRASR